MTMLGSRFSAANAITRDCARRNLDAHLLCSVTILVACSARRTVRGRGPPARIGSAVEAPGAAATGRPASIRGGESYRPLCSGWFSDCE